ncbi:hypothetical protein OESDEN_24935 [Oesophagostomum dentatum]|uniref:Protein kinase domain-containing protein n=1 Tax=Oesophagostomum dentatum TaxID=61180 RepID=A0A0B1RS32_OESDE|nr:hypothetical protein OESDEN_24935 [Oesophagostomum dentatum]
MDGVVPDKPAPQIPLRWMAPESLRRPMRFSAKTDVWSFAVLLYEIFNNGQKPWKSEPARKIATMIRRCQMPSFPKQAPEDIGEIAAKIWVADPKARPSMKDVGYLLVSASKKYAAPPPEKFAVNNIEGVTRTKAVCHYSLVKERTNLFVVVTFTIFSSNVLVSGGHSRRGRKL